MLCYSAPHLATRTGGCVCARMYVVRSKRIHEHAMLNAALPHTLRCAQVAVFAPGMYEVGDYSILWKGGGSKAVGGSCPGPPFLLIVEAV